MTRTPPCHPQWPEFVTQTEQTKRKQNYMSNYVLQRYMIHADAHIGENFRVFTQFKSGLEDGRNGGPRPTDRDAFDVHQLFADVRLPFAEEDSLTLRAGRQELSFGTQRLVS